MRSHHATAISPLLVIGSLMLAGCASDTAATREAETSPEPKAMTATATERVSARPGMSGNSSGDEAVNAYVRALRDDLSRGKVGIITDVMALNADEAKTFWPIYQEYETELFELGDRRIEVIRQFVTDRQRGTFRDAEATRLATEYFDFEGRRLELMKTYHARVAEELSPVRAAQFAQVEHRVGTLIDLLIAAELPLVAPAAATAAR